MSSTVETIKYKGHKISIIQDEDPQNPLTDWDMLGTFVCFHRRYDLSSPKHGFSDSDEFREYKENHADTIVVLPLFLYDHSGITMRTGPFNCPWDSGQVGWIYATKARVEKEFGDFSEESQKKAIACMESEVKSFDDYLTGNVYGYDIENGDSCWGYFGDYRKSGIIEEAKSRVDYEINQKVKNHIAQLKSWIKSKVAFNYRKPLELI